MQPACIAQNASSNNSNRPLDGQYLHGDIMTTGQKPGLRRLAATLLATAASAFAMGSAHAAYPDKPVRIVVGFSAGGTTDVICLLYTSDAADE